jgi:cellulase/cellobiase CelA1
VANVTVANTGTSAINGWTLGFTLPAGQSVTSSWNTTLSGANGALTARNIAWNGSIPAGGNASFGFQGTFSGSFATPSAFSLNGSACTKA